MRFFLILLLFSSFRTEAQHNLDSLWGVWNDENADVHSRSIAINTVVWKTLLFSKPDSAYQLIRQGYEVVEKSDDHTMMAMLLRTMGVSCHLQSKLDEALMHYNEALKLDRLENDSLGIAKTLNNIGTAYQFQDNLDDALAAYTESLDIAKKLGNDQKAIATAEGNIGLILELRGDYEGAARRYENSLRIDTTINFVSGMAASHGNLARIYKYLHDYRRAIEEFNLAVEYHKMSSRPALLANSYNNMGNAYYELGNISKSLDCYEKSYAIIKGLNDPHKLALSLVNLANTYQDLGQLEKAFELFDTANAISTANHFSKGIALTENNLGNLYKQKGQYDKAMDYYKQSIAVSGDFENPEEYTNALCNMAGTLRLLDQMETARDSALKAFSLAWKFSPYNVYDNALKLLYLTSMALKDYKSAGAYLDSLLDKDKQEVYMNFPVLSEREKGQFFQTLQPEFDLCYDYAYYSGKAEPQRVDDAYDLALMTKGLLLKSSTAMRQAILSSKDTALIRQYEEWIALKRRIARNYSDGKETKQLEEDANNLEKRLVLGSEEFLDMQRIKGLSWKEVQKKLAEGEAAVEFVRFNHFNYYYNDSLNKPLYCALIIDKNCDHPTMVELFEEDQLEKILGSFPGNNLSYIDQVYGTKDNIKSQLYNLIWKPMESVLEGKGKVLISPVGLLHKISFSALAKEQDVFLSDLYEIENKSSTGKTATTGQVNYGTDERITLFGGINYNSDSTSNEIWQYLDGSLTEDPEQKIQ